jgi:dTDP-4-dehydrorhamnose 3,5-epimerase
MKFIKTKIAGMYYVDLEPRGDDRGYFVRQYAEEEYQQKAGINFKMVQTNQAFTKDKGVLRGMHWQEYPKLEPKVFQCLDGEVYDVVADVRRDSPTYGKWLGTALKGDKLRLLYIPGGLAHGYETLTENCRVQYMVGEFYSPEQEKGIRWDDPFFKIKWPLKPAIMSDKDKSFADFKK